MEVVKRPGDFAIVGAVVGCAIENGLITEPRISLFGVASRPVRVPSAEAALAGSCPGPETFARAAEQLQDDIEPDGDAHASADYRSHVAATLVQRALKALS